jgi:hypothetical protein
MGEGTADIMGPNKGWKYPTPDSSAEQILKQICGQ